VALAKSLGYAGALLRIYWRCSLLHGSLAGVYQFLDHYFTSMKVLSACGILGMFCLLSRGTTKAHSQQFDQLRSVPIQAVTIEDSFWSPKRKIWQAVTIPDCFAKFENDRGGALNNFDRVRDRKSDGHAGPPWYDGLIYEMIRGSADFLAAKPDPVLESRIDGYVARIKAAQDRDPDGYLNTWTQLQHPNQRWGLNGGNDGYQHEMYNVGALVRGGGALLPRHRQESLVEGGGQAGKLHLRSGRGFTKARTRSQSRDR
jgi:hypothetical protein